MSSLALTATLGGDYHGTWPQVFVTHGPGPRRASDAGTVATIDHHRCRTGPTGEDYPPPGGRVLPIRRGAGRRRATDRGPSVGQALSRPACGWPDGRPWPRRQGRFSPRRWRSTWCAWPANVQTCWVVVSPNGIATNWRQLIAEGIVEDISASTVRRILAVHQLKPW